MASLQEPDVRRQPQLLLDSGGGGTRGMQHGIGCNNRSIPQKTPGTTPLSLCLIFVGVESMDDRKPRSLYVYTTVPSKCCQANASDVCKPLSLVLVQR